MGPLSVSVWLANDHFSCASLKMVAHQMPNEYCRRRNDVKTAFDVAKTSVVSRILTLTGVHGHLTAALLAEMQDVWGSASFENSETEFRY